MFKSKKPSSKIKELKEMSTKLSFAEIGRSFGRMLELQLLKGNGYSVGLLKEDIIAVAKTYVSKGAKFPAHNHDEWEMLLVYTGKLKICLANGEKKILGPKDFYYILPGMEHQAIALEETKFIAMTIPGSEFWPEGG